MHPIIQLTLKVTEPTTSLLVHQSPSSCVVLKENVLRQDGPALADDEDASQTRSDPHLRRLFAKVPVYSMDP